MTDWLLEQTLIFTVTAAFLSLLRRPLRQKLGATGFYVLWAIIPIQLLLSGMSVSNHLPELTVLNTYIVTASKAVTVSQYALSSWVPQVETLWVVGATTCFLFVVCQHAIFVRNLHRSKLSHNYFDNDPALASYPSGNVSIEVSQHVKAPVIMGLVKHAIVLPPHFFRLSAKQKSLILEHELVHLSRGDLYWNLLALSVLCLNWFNPVAWISYRHFREAQEMACDAQVLANKSKQTKVIYAKTLLAESFQNESELLTTLHYGGKQNMKQRIKNIQTGFTYNWRLLPVAMVLLGGALTFQAVGESVTAVNAKAEAYPVMRVPPVYPGDAAKNGIQGTVVLAFSIEKSGSVSDVKVLESDHGGIFDQAAIQALQQWKYSKPGVKMENQSVAIEFVLESKVTSKQAEDREVIHVKAD